MTTDHHNAALRRFRRAMRRHEKRARRMGLHDAAYCIAWHRRAIGYSTLRARAAVHRVKIEGTPRSDAQIAFLYEHAADAVARLREATP